MGFRYSAKSEAKLETCCWQLQLLMRYVLQKWDNTIMEGHRTDEKQEELFAAKMSKKRGGESKHNRLPSLAVDVVPFVNGKPSFNQHHCMFFAGYVLAVAELLNIPVRWGGNWDGDGEVVTDQSFQDLCHFEIEEK